MIFQNCLKPSLLNQNVLDRYRNIFCVDSLCAATGIYLFCYVRGFHLLFTPRLQSNPYFCVFKYPRVVIQKVWNEAENRKRDWEETLPWTVGLFSLASHTLRALKLALRAGMTLTPRFTDFFTDFEKKTGLFCTLFFRPFSASNSVVKRDKGYTLVPVFSC